VARRGMGVPPTKTKQKENKHMPIVIWTHDNVEGATDSHSPHLHCDKCLEAITNVQTASYLYPTKQEETDEIFYVHNKCLDSFKLSLDQIFCVVPLQDFFILLDKNSDMDNNLSGETPPEFN
jgi:hypothetical protein